MKSFLFIPLLLLTITAANAQQMASKNKIIASEEVASAAPLSEIPTPLFPGGEPALCKYIKKNIKYPSSHSGEKTEGTVTVRFLIDADGNVKNAIVPEGQGVSKCCDDEAVRVVMALPKWTPATRGGTAVSYWCEVPITFRMVMINL